MDRGSEKSRNPKSTRNPLPTHPLSIDRFSGQASLAGRLSSAQPSGSWKGTLTKFHFGQQNGNWILLVGQNGWMQRIRCPPADLSWTFFVNTTTSGDGTLFVFIVDFTLAVLRFNVNPFVTVSRFVEEKRNGERKLVSSILRTEYVRSCAIWREIFNENVLSR